LIWGIINSGSRWINQTAGGRLPGPVVPNRLIIHIRGPGTLVALRGQDRIATLLNGKLQDYGFNIFEASWLAHLQERFAKWVLHECFKGQPHTGATVERDFTRVLAQNVMRRVISQVRDARHGGMIIIIADPNWNKLVCANGPISPKYWIKDSKARRRYRELLFAVVRTLSEVGAEIGLATVGWEQYQQIKDDRLAELDESVFECAHLLADLMAVDGALVLTAARDIIGFGEAKVFSALRASISPQISNRVEKTDNDLTGLRLQLLTIDGQPSQEMLQTYPGCRFLIFEFTRERVLTGS
jgi:hypothetical protein